MLLRRWRQTFLWDVKKRLLQLQKPLKTMPRLSVQLGCLAANLFEFRARNEAGHHRDFLTVGGMGHASQIALGLAMAQPARPIYCFDGDGAGLMHMGSMAITGQSNAKNLIHLVFNNGVHGSVGGQPTVGFNIDMPQIATACGYATAQRVNDQRRIFKSDHYGARY